VSALLSAHRTGPFAAAAHPAQWTACTRVRASTSTALFTFVSQSRCSHVVLASATNTALLPAHLFPWNLSHRPTALRSDGVTLGTQLEKTEACHISSLSRQRQISRPGHSMSLFELDGYKPRLYATRDFLLDTCFSRNHLSRPRILPRNHTASLFAILTLNKDPLLNMCWNLTTFHSCGHTSQGFAPCNSYLRQGNVCQPIRPINKTENTRCDACSGHPAPC
jgi:hypothetical protein